MKKSILKMDRIIGFVWVALMWMSCSKEDTVVADRNIDMSEKMRITINVESFGEDLIRTRSSVENFTKEMVDLGNGLMAEIALLEDNDPEQQPVTRALTAGTYWIYAIDHSGNRVSGPNSLLKGNVVSEYDPATSTWFFKFVADSDYRLVLAPGTYTFVCYNEDVTDNGVNLSVQNGAQNPLIGVATETISGKDWKVAFQMKRQIARLKFHLGSLTGDCGENAAGVYSAEASVIPIAAVPKENMYTMDASSYTQTTGTDFSLNCPPTYVYSSDFPFIWQGKTLQPRRQGLGYAYILPGAEGTNLELKFTGGTCYRKSLASLGIALNALGTIVRNKSYVLHITFLPKFVYLFHDGSTGYLSDKGSRTPIGIVLRNKNGGTKGLAVALNSAGTFKAFNWPRQNNVVFTNVANAVTDMNGYSWTWDASTSSDGELKATSNNYPAFKAAAEYNPGVATSGIGRWFLPSLGQIELFAYTVGFSRKSTGQSMLGCARSAFFYAFSAAGGTADNFQDFTNFVSSTCYGQGSCWRYWTNTCNGFYDSAYDSTVLPFVEF